METRNLTMAIIFKLENSSQETKGTINCRTRILNGETYYENYIPIQVLRHGLINQMGKEYKDIGGDKTLLQSLGQATIDRYPELDLFGYAKQDEGKVRLSLVRLSNPVSLEEVKDGSNMSYYGYSISIDLHRVGIDNNYNMEVGNMEKADRLIDLIHTIKNLYIDTGKGKKYLRPLFVIGGLYGFDDGIFHGNLSIEDNKINLEKIRQALAGENIGANTYCGLEKGIFTNEDEIIGGLGARSIAGYFDIIQGKVMDYYNS